MNQKIAARYKEDVPVWKNLIERAGAKVD